MLRRLILPVFLVLAAVAQPSAEVKADFRVGGKTVSAVTGQPLARTEVFDRKGRTVGRNLAEGTHRR